MGKDHHHESEARGWEHESCLFRVFPMCNFEIYIMNVNNWWFGLDSVAPNKEACQANRIDLAFRDYCSHKLIPLNQCRCH
jgi:hypothetical protein